MILDNVFGYSFVAVSSQVDIIGQPTEFHRFQAHGVGDKHFAQPNINFADPFFGLWEVVPRNYLNDNKLCLQIVAEIPQIVF